MENAAINVRGLTKIYKGELGEKSVTGLNDLNLIINPGEVFAFIGPNGAGKTTAIKMCMRLIFPSSGKVEIFGRANTRRESMNRIGYLPEQPRMYEYLTGREFLDFIGRLFGMSREARREKGNALLDTVGLTGRRDTLIRNYSRGMMQRLGLAQALINDPDILILDEPMASLDPVGRKDFRDLILALKAEGKTIFFSSHILSDAEMIADRVGILKEGRLIRVAGLDELIGAEMAPVEVTLRLAEDKRRRIGIDVQEIAVQGTQAMIRLGDRKQLAGLIAEISALGGEIISVIPQRKSLEDIFIDELGRP